MSESTQIEVLKLALEALESITWVNSFNEGDYLTCNFKIVETSITAIKDALAQQNTCGGCFGSWIGLTQEDKKEYVAQDFGGSRLDAMDWTEKRLKEKNTNA